MTHECYEGYTVKRTIEGIQKDRNPTEDPPPSTCHGKIASRPFARSSHEPTRDPVVPNEVGIYQKTCVICSEARHKTEYMKYCISEKGRAEKFLKTTLVLLDDVCTRTSDLQNISSVFEADLYCHKECIRIFTHFIATDT